MYSNTLEGFKKALKDAKEQKIGLDYRFYRDDEEISMQLNREIAKVQNKNFSYWAGSNAITVNFGLSSNWELDFANNKFTQTISNGHKVIYSFTKILTQ